MGGGKSCGGNTLKEVSTTRWIMGLWSTYVKVEGDVPRAACTGVEITVSLMTHLGNQATPHCM